MIGRLSDCRPLGFPTNRQCRTPTRGRPKLAHQSCTPLPDASQDLGDNSTNHNTLSRQRQNVSRCIHFMTQPGGSLFCSECSASSLCAARPKAE